MTTTTAVDAGLKVRLGEGPLPPASWARLLADAERPVFSHDPLWTAAVCTRLPGRSGLWLLVEDDGRPVAGLPLVRVQRGPLTRIQGHHEGVTVAPLLAADLPPSRADRALDLLAEACSVLAGGSRSAGLMLHLRPEWDARFGPRLAANGFRRSGEPSSVLPLAGGEEHVLDRVLGRTRRKELARSDRAGATTGVSTDPADLDAFVSLYDRVSAERGSPPAPRELLSDLLADGAGRIFLTVVRHEGAFLGAHVCWCDGDHLTAWIGATVPAAGEVAPATLLMREDVREACARGFTHLDLGAHGGNDGAAHAKALLGAETVERGCWERIPWTGRVARGALRLVRGRGRA